MMNFADVQRGLGLHQLAVEDAVRARDRPKLDVYDETRFFALVTLRHRSAMAPLDVGRVMAFVGDVFVVTVRQEEGDTAADRLFAQERSDEAHLLYQLSRKLLSMTHAVQPLIEPLRHLSGGTAGVVDVETARRFQDVPDHALVVDREIGEHSALVEHLRDSNDSRIALQQNTDMRKIAAWAAVIAVPAAVTGFYGMNVPYPGYGETAGVVTAIAVQILLAVTLFITFRRRGWL